MHVRIVEGPLLTEIHQAPPRTPTCDPGAHMWLLLCICACARAYLFAVQPNLSDDPGSDTRGQEEGQAAFNLLCGARTGKQHMKSFMVFLRLRQQQTCVPLQCHSIVESTGSAVGRKGTRRQFTSMGPRASR